MFMDAFFTMLRNVILFVLLAVPGYLLVKKGVMKQEQSAVLSKMLVHIGMPFLILNGTVTNIEISAAFLLKLALVVCVGVAYTLLQLLASKPVMAMEKNQKCSGMMRFCSVFPNSGFLGIPLAIAVFGASSPVLPVLIILNIVTNILMYAFGPYLVCGDKSSISFKKALTNPLLIAFLVGMLLNFLNVKQYIPEVVSYAGHFSNIVTPISMTVVGMKLATIKFSSLFTTWKTYYVSAFKLIVFPAVIVAVLWVAGLWTDVITADMLLGFFIAFGVPTAGLASTFADNFGGDQEGAVIFTFGTTILSVITIPVLYWILNLCI